tara:strand:+ start:1198 stop:1476 length:279 start_codon:yes stop_codon:yes gene_type:complete
MSKYFCPFCDPKYQFPRKDNNGNVYCSLCGDYMFKEPTINFKKIIAFFLSLAFILPIILVFLFNSFNGLENKKNKNTKPAISTSMISVKSLI